MLKHSLSFIVVLVVSAILFTTIFAGTTGKIAGVVTDEETGKPLPAANVIVIGTPLGAAADQSGRYVILNVPPGTYSVKASMMGYAPVTLTDVKVSADVTTSLNIALSPRVIEFPEGIVVVARRPMILKDVTATRHFVTGETIDNQPIHSLQEAAMLQAGVVGAHFRGGRVGETMVLVDGLPVKDPVSAYRGYMGGFTSDLPEMSISEMEVLTGGFNAEYGNIQSGVMNVVTKEGGEVFSGKLSLRTTSNRITGDTAIVSVVGYTKDGDTIKVSNLRRVRDVYEFSLSGPIPIIPFSMKYFVSGEISNQKRGDFPNQDFLEHTYQGKLSVKLAPTMKLILGGHTSWNDYNIYSHRYSKYGMLDHLADRHRKTNQRYLNWTHTISSNTFYELRFGHFFSGYHAAVKDVDDYDQDGNTEEELIWEGPEPPSLPHEEAHYRNRVREDIPGGWFWASGDENFWMDQNAEVYTVKADLTSQVTFNHMLKIGLEFNWNDMRVRRVRWTTVGQNVYDDHWSQDCIDFAIYAQDKMEFKQLIVNFGLRLDYFNANGFGEKAWFPADQSDPLEGGKIKNPIAPKPRYQLSPRLGVSHPITERDILRFSYGHFFQRPDARFLYENLGGYAIGAIPNVGYPDLIPEKTVAYEIGVEHMFTNDLKGSFTAYFKDITNLVDQKHYYCAPLDYDVYTNVDYGNVRGAEFVLTKRQGRYLGGTFNYTYSVAKGRSSSPYAGGHYAYYEQLMPEELNFLDWDQRHTIKFNLNLTIQPFLITNVTYEYGSGLPYSSPSRALRPPVNDKRLPPTSNTDLKIIVKLPLGRITPSLFLECINLFNKRNILWLASVEKYEMTGDPTGYHNNPTVYSNPRILRGGIRIDW
ncbi:MAG TPA: TonB-dependent receptor [bacterium (Candidatus Stahlbacteria)]|nr:TonB-dependent receptor [Candidatus Stahlbacteria bacterium]